MNKMKKASLFLLILTLILGSAVPAMAATGSITVENAVAEQTYTAYQIFDVTYNADGTAYSYQIAENSQWYASVNAYAENGTLTLTKAEDGREIPNYVVTVDDSFSAADFANYLKTQLTADMIGTTLIAQNGKATASGLALGYYFVTSSTGALCNLTTTDPSASIYDKNDIPFEKTDDQQDVEVGQRVNYAITGKVPSTTGFASYKYEIADTMSDGLTFQNDVEVFVDGSKLDESFYTYTPHEAGNGFALSINVMELQDYVAKEISVTYSAITNENAIASIEKNAATLTYTSDPTTGTEMTTEPDEEKVYSSKLVIDKYAETGEERISLSGAKFVLKNEDGLFYQYVAPVADDPETEADETVAAKVNWVSDQSDATEIETDENGAAFFGGLKDGTYFLIETKAPEGYNLLTAPHEVEINGSDENESLLTLTTSIQNMFGAELPETGGMGTTIFYLLGGALVAGAFIALITRKRMRTEK